MSSLKNHNRDRMKLMIKYVTARPLSNRPRIDVIEVDRETESSVWIGGRRRAKQSVWDCYFDTFDEAKAFLTAKAEARLTAARLRLNDAQGFAGNVKGLKEPSKQEDEEG